MTNDSVNSDTLSLSNQLRAAGSRARSISEARRAFNVADALDHVTNDPDADVSEMVATWRNAHMLLVTLTQGIN
jgi:hypothetical protein